ncbi:hypothetical protein KC352_g33275, partial [Hortaea werneckii]
PDRGAKLNHLLSSESVKAGHNHKVQDFQHSLQPLQNEMQYLGTASHSHTAGGPMAMFAQQRSLDAESSGQAYSGGYAGGAGPHDYAQASYSHAPPPAPAGFAPEGGSAFPTAYQQGYEAPYSQAPPPPPQGGYQQGYQTGYGQSGGYGGYGDPSQGYGHHGGGGYGRY